MAINRRDSNSLLTQYALKWQVYLAGFLIIFVIYILLFYRIEFDGNSTPGHSISSKHDGEAKLEAKVEAKDGTTNKEEIFLAPKVRTGRFRLAQKKLDASTELPKDMGELLRPDKREENATMETEIFDIYFIETAYNPILTPRQVCAIESTARVHYDHRIIILYTADRLNFNPIQMQILESNYTRNLYFAMVDLKLLFKGTPLQYWYESGNYKKSEHKTVHLSDAVRLAVLYHRGGAYLDMDIVMMKRLPFYWADIAIGRQQNSILANGVVYFKKGHQLLWDIMVEFNTTYNPLEFSMNGPELLTKMIVAYCKVENLTFISERLHGVRILHPIFFYPVHWVQWQVYFMPFHLYNVLYATKDSVLIHLWNRLSSQVPVRINSRSAYDVLMAEHCPYTYRFTMDKYGMM